MNNGIEEARKVLAEARARANGSAFQNEKEEASKQVIQVVHGLVVGVGYEAELGRGGEILSIKSPWRSDEWLTLRASDAGVKLELGDGNGPSKKGVASPAMTYDAVKKTWNASKGDETPVLMIANAIARAFDQGDAGVQAAAAKGIGQAAKANGERANGERAPQAGAQGEVRGR